MPVKETTHSYPLIDADPHFSRVIRFMRPTDYAVWAGTTGAFPSLLRLWERTDTSGSTIRELRTAVRLNAFLGFCAGFMLAYQNSSMRFWGWRENARELEKDQRELSALARAGKPLYGESEMEPYLQGVAARNSTFSQLKFQTMPWFNLVNHNDHGTDPSKYAAESQSQPS